VRPRPVKDRLNGHTGRVAGVWGWPGGRAQIFGGDEIADYRRTEVEGVVSYVRLNRGDLARVTVAL